MINLVDLVNRVFVIHTDKSKCETSENLLNSFQRGDGLLVKPLMILRSLSTLERFSIPRRMVTPEELFR